MSVSVRRRGNRGRPLSVTTNSFKIETLPCKNYHQYDVVITPEPRSFRHAQEIVDRLQTHTAPHIFHPKALYDGQAILFASHQLNLSGGGSGNFNVLMSDRPPPPGAPVRGVYSVKLTRAAAQVVEFSALTDLITGKGGSSPRTLTAINLLQLLIRAAPNLMYPHNLRSYYTSAGREPIGGGLELWRGFFQSVRPSIGQMIINVDVSVSAMYGSGPLPNVALNVLGSRNSRDLDVPEDHANFRKLKSFLKNLLVMVTPTGGDPNERSRKKKIRGLVANAGNFEFEKDGVLTTVKIHFQEAHGYRLRQPGMFGILVGSKEKAIVFPAEVCTVVEGQIYKKKVPQELTPQVVKFATSPPGDRLAAIQQSGGARAPIFEYPSSPFMQDAGVRVSPTPIRIDGRVLPPPTLVFGDNQATRIQNGGWNVTKSRFKEPMPLVAWAVVDYSRSQGKAQRFVEMLQSCFNVLGMKYLPPYTCVANGQGNISGDLMDISRVTMNWAGEQVSMLPPNDRPSKPSRIALVICLLPFPAAEIRRAIKHFGDVETGIPTQCIRADKISHKDNQLNQYCNNVALKINVRLGGLNSITRSPSLDELQKAKFMIVGADVGHPGAGIQNQPSVASMVWSFDQHAMKYVAFSSVQEPRQEGIEDLKPMMKRALDAFGQIQAPPARIVVFRDGLSEGEWEGAGQLEIKKVEGAINEVWEERKPPFPKPKLTYIVVGKRHHVRFFPKPGEGDNRSGNCPPGFVADAGIDSPLANDFFMLSHGGLLGTSRPSHYTILKDDIFGNNPDALQELAYTLCHCYAKATRSVSIPCPVYYADLVCARASFHFDQNLRYDDATSASSGGAQFDIRSWRDGYRPLHAGLKKSMYFL